MTEPKLTPEQQLVLEHGSPSKNLSPYPLTASDQSGGVEPALSLTDFLKILRRRRAIVINTFVLVVVLGLVLTLITTPRFSSTARILVEGKMQTVAISDTKNPLGNLFIPTVGHDVRTQVEILRSPLVINEVYKASKIPPGSVTLEVRAVPETDLIDVTATSTSRAHAEGFAKALPEVYLYKVKGERVAELKAALSFARRRMAEQKQKLDAAELALQQFQQQHGVVSPERATRALEELSAAQTTVRQAQTEVEAARGRLVALESARSGVSKFLQTPVTTTNPEIANLKNRIAQLQDQRADLLFQFKPGEDEVKKVDLQIKQLQSRLASTSATVTSVSRAPNPAVSNLDAQITDARVALKSAEAALTAAQARASEVGKGPDLSTSSPLERASFKLQRSVELARGSLDSLTQSAEDLMLREQAAEAKNNPVSVIAEAGPAQQVSPRVVRNMMMAVFLGMLLACGMAMLQHSLDDHVNDEEEARSLLDVSILGVLPLVVSEAGKKSAVAFTELNAPAKAEAQAPGKPALVLSRDEPHLMESFRMLRSNVYFALVNSPKRSILVTSTVQGEGKTTTASNLAMVMALDGRRVILVDADMRRPSLDQFFNLSRQPGLSNVLVGQTSWREALRNTNVSGLRVLTSGALPPNPAELLNSAALDNLIHELEAECDMLIFDTPPCPATADTQVLSAKVDGVVYVMHLGRVRKAGLYHAFDLLHQANAHILGVVFNKFESPASHRYGYYYGYHEYGSYGSDHTSTNGQQANSHHQGSRFSHLLKSNLPTWGKADVEDAGGPGAHQGTASAPDDPFRSNSAHSNSAHRSKNPHHDLPASGAATVEAATSDVANAHAATMEGDAPRSVDSSVTGTTTVFDQEKYRTRSDRMDQ